MVTIDPDSSDLTDGQEGAESMNLALRDIRHNLSRFLLTALGVGMLLMLVMGMEASTEVS